MKDKEEFIFEKPFEAAVNSCIKHGYVIPSYCFKNYNDKIKYAAYIFYNDKKDYLATNTWPTRKFWMKDLIWTFYYYLQITDCNMDLDKYFDFSYDTNKWKRKDLENLLLKYGTNILFIFSIYAGLDTDKSFDEWYETDYQEKHSYLDNVQETLESFNTFDKVRRK